ncbi:MAG: hypothetical protein KDD00_14070 [Ignavibacteriae bacterium]|nr:hypothetical protein [Ignavibacteriota bacterium]
MINSKLFKILKSFDRTEWKNFKRFSSSSYFSKGRILIPFLNIIDRFYPEFDDEELTMENIYEGLYPGKPFKKNVINVFLSSLTSAAESFIVMNKIENNPQRKNTLLNESYLERGLINLFDSGLKSSLKDLNKNKERSNNYWYYKYIFDSQINSRKMKLEEATYFFDDNFKESEKIFYYYFLHEMCRFYQPVLDPVFVYQSSNKLSYLLNFLMGELEKTFESCPQTLQCYYFYFKLILTKKREYFDKMFLSLEQTEDLFETPELRNFYITLLNYLCHSYNKHSSSLNEYFEITEIMLRKDLLQRNDGYIEPHSLLNMVNIMNKDNSDIAIEFVENNFKKLDPKIRNSVYDYCMGVINLKKGNKEESLKYLAKVDPIDYLMKLNADLYRFSLFYELKYFENALSLCDSVSEYLKYHKEINKEMKPLYIDFLNCYRQLIKINSGKFNSSEVDELEILIESKNSLFLKSWFLKKIEEMKTETDQN